MTESAVNYVAWSSCVGVLMICGLLGNACTLWAIGYATIRKRYDMSGASWLSTTIFILNLAFVDTVYCLFFLIYMVYGSTIPTPSSVTSEDESWATCKFFVLGFQQLSLIDGWSIALIAFTRPFPYIK